MGILPGFIAISALYFTVAACMLLYVAALCRCSGSAGFEDYYF